MTPEKQTELKALRVSIDADIKTVSTMKRKYLDNSLPNDGIRELEKTHTKLQEAKMWVGKVMEALGSELPAEFRDEAK